nr:MAG TPA: hypothetical protein [Caudoviricetes sp.]
MITCLDALVSGGASGQHVNTACQRYGFFFRVVLANERNLSGGYVAIRHSVCGFHGCDTGRFALLGAELFGRFKRIGLLTGAAPRPEITR